jgi:hypothetical protein
LVILAAKSGVLRDVFAASFAKGQGLRRVIDQVFVDPAT